MPFLRPGVGLISLARDLLPCRLGEHWAGARGPGAVELTSTSVGCLALWTKKAELGLTTQWGQENRPLGAPVLARNGSLGHLRARSGVTRTRSSDGGMVEGSVQA